MAESTENRIRCALTTMLNDVDKLHLRQLQGEMHACAAKCCEDRVSSVDLVHACIQGCNENLEKAQKVVQNEIFHLQKRFQSCVVRCNNEVKGRISSHPIDQQIKSYETDFEDCIEKCIDSNIALIPFIMKKMKDVLANKPSAGLKEKQMVKSLQ